MSAQKYSSLHFARNTAAGIGDELADLGANVLVAAEEIGRGIEHDKPRPEAFHLVKQVAEEGREQALAGFLPVERHQQVVEPDARPETQVAKLAVINPIGAIDAILVEMQIVFMVLAEKTEGAKTPNREPEPIPSRCDAGQQLLREQGLAHAAVAIERSDVVHGYPVLDQPLAGGERFA